LNITVRNLYPDLELISPVYFSDCTACHVSPKQRVDTGNTMETSFGIGLKQKYLKGALLYKLQRKYVDRTDNQLGSNMVSNKGTTTNMYLLVVWNDGCDSYGFYVYLIECPIDFTWDEDRLWILYKEYKEKFHENYRSNINTWLMNGGALMRTKLDVTYGSDYKLDIIISEGAWEHKMLKPMKIDPKTLVLSLSILDMPIYVAESRIPPSFKLNIHNQCLNIDLVSPTYFTDDGLECHRPPSYKVCTGETMRSGFMSEVDNQFNAALIYRLQKKLPHESSEISKNTSSAAHLLVFWRVTRSNELYTDVLVVEHDKRFVWNENDLEDLHIKNIDPSRLHSDSVTEMWSLNDNVALMTTSEVMNEDLIVDITISEVEKCHSTRTPIDIDLKR
jgi:hypothetical protein